MMEVRRDRKGKGQIMLLNGVVREDSKKVLYQKKNPFDVWKTQKEAGSGKAKNK